MLVTHKVKTLWLALSQKDTCCELASNKGTIVKLEKFFFGLLLNIMNMPSLEYSHPHFELLSINVYHIQHTMLVIITS
jgi:hypothetical protein